MVETVIEFKIHRDQARFEKGKRQVAHNGEDGKYWNKKLSSTQVTFQKI